MASTFRARVLLLACLAVNPAWGAEDLSEDEVRARLIEESIAGYAGNCPCPYNVDRAGHRCGGRSAWSRAGGSNVLCFPADVSDDLVKRWRQRHS